jgi:hypothetical protein
LCDQVTLEPERLLVVAATQFHDLRKGHCPQLIHKLLVGSQVRVVGCGA